MDEKLQMIIMSLQAKLGRLPTEDEVIDFIFGSDKDRERVWNA